MVISTVGGRCVCSAVPLRSRLVYLSVRMFGRQKGHKPANNIRTLRDKQRRIILTNQIDRADTLSSSKAVELLSKAKSRATFVQGKIYEHWNPDFLKEATENARPLNAGATMDARWWFWNVLFAMAPALVIGFYCEFIGQHKMYESRKEQEIQQMKKIMGDGFVDEHMEDLITPPPRRFHDRLQTAVQDIIELARGLVEDGEFSLPERDITPETLNERIDRVRQINSGGTATKRVALQTQTNGSTSRDDIETLADRIERLEALVANESQGTTQTFTYHRERVQQSGVQNRMEDKKLEDWKQKIEHAKEAKEHEAREHVGGRLVRLWQTAHEYWGHISELDMPSHEECTSQRKESDIMSATKVPRLPQGGELSEECPLPSQQDRQQELRLNNDPGDRGDSAKSNSIAWLSWIGRHSSPPESGPK